MMRLCLIGHPVKHSLSPPMHRAAFLYFGIDGTYDLIDIEPESLSDRLPRLMQEFSGFNVTIPHKEALYQFIENRSAEANLVGAVNTVRIDSSGQVFAHNTDMKGFVTAFRAAVKLKSGLLFDEYFPNVELKSALILGAGGAARAALAGLALLGFRKILLVARRPEPAMELIRSMNESVSAYLNEPFAASFLDLNQIESTHGLSAVVNCTSIGLGQEDQLPSWSNSLFSNMAQPGFFFDTVYRRDQNPTCLMNLANASEVSSLDGLGMLMEQARLAFEYWTGRLPPADLFCKAMRESGV